MRKRILLTGGGSGGHVFPLVAVLDEIRRFAGGDIKVSYIGPRHKLNEEFEKREIKVYKILGAKLRRYFDLRNFIDVPKFFISFLQALFKLYFLMPDLVFSKGGTSALPVVLAARFYFIPVVIHESDSVPGLTNRLSAHFAKKVFISFRTAINYFSPKKTELVGNPIRLEILTNRVQNTEAAKTRIRFKPEEPLIVFLGGSQGAEHLNEFVFNNFKEIISFTQVFHQVGADNLNHAERLRNSSERYRYGGFLNAEEIKSVLAAADVVVSRTGSGAIFEIASFGKPAILVPLPESAGDHQRVNAYEYERSGAAIVVEESNLSWGILKLEIEKILNESGLKEKMSQAALSFAKPEAAEMIVKRTLELV